MHTRFKGLMATARWFVPATALALVGCPNQELAPLEPCTVSGVNLDAAGDGVDKVDLLFMIDNSGSMAQEQAKLGAKLGNLVGVLTSGNKSYPNPPADASSTFTPAKSLHIGVITSNMGAPPGVQMTASAVCAGNGENGVLQSSGRIAAMDQVDVNTRVTVKPGVPACAQVGINPPYLAFGTAAGEIDKNNPQALNDALFQFGCIATVGVSGCGIEQQLESSLKALLPGSFNDFYGPDQLGQGDRANAGFLRNDSVLAIVMVTDEDDCSVTPAGTVMFERGGMPAVNVRCQLLKDDPAYAPTIQPISRYVERFIGLRSTFPERLVFAGIVGLPTAGVDTTNFDALLANPQMTVQLDPNAGMQGTDLVGVCGSDTGDGKAYPGRRFVQLAKGLAAGGAGTVLTSICAEDYTPALSLIIDKIAQQLAGACLPRPLQKDATTGTVTCDVVEILAKDAATGADVGSCTGNGRKPAAGGTRKVGDKDRTACVVDQYPAGPGGSDPGQPGWYYDDQSEELMNTPGCMGGQRVVFSKTAELQSGAIARVECFAPQPRIVQNTRGLAAINTSCADDENLCNSLSIPNETLLCERSSRSCQIACNSTANCPEGWLCAAPMGSDQRFCQNPTCSVTGTN